MTSDSKNWDGVEPTPFHKARCRYSWQLVSLRTSLALVVAWAGRSTPDLSGPRKLGSHRARVPYVRRTCSWVSLLRSGSGERSSMTGGEIGRASCRERV